MIGSPRCIYLIAAPLPTSSLAMVDVDMDGLSRPVARLIGSTCSDTRVASCSRAIAVAGTFLALSTGSSDDGFARYDRMISMITRRSHLPAHATSMAQQYWHCLLLHLWLRLHRRLILVGETFICHLSIRSHHLKGYIALSRSHDNTRSGTVQIRACRLRRVLICILPTSVVSWRWWWLTGIVAWKLSITGWCRWCRHWLSTCGMALALNLVLTLVQRRRTLREPKTRLDSAQTPPEATRRCPIARSSHTLLDQKYPAAQTHLAALDTKRWNSMLQEEV